MKFDEIMPKIAATFAILDLLLALKIYHIL